MWPTAARLAIACAEVAVHVEAPADAGLGAVRPREHAVGPPDLDRHEGAVVPELVGQPGGGVAGDLHLAAADELSAQHAVDVLGDARAAVGDRLVGDRPGQGGAEQDPPAAMMHALASRKTRSSVTDRSVAARRFEPVPVRSRSHGSRIRYRIGDAERLEPSRTLDSAPWISTSSSSAPRARSRRPSAPRRRCSCAAAASGCCSTAARARSGRCCAPRSASSSCARCSSRTSTPTTTSACPGC